MRREARGDVEEKLSVYLVIYAKLLLLQSSVTKEWVYVKNV